MDWQDVPNQVADLCNRLHAPAMFLQEHVSGPIACWLSKNAAVLHLETQEPVDTRPLSQHFDFVRQSPYPPSLDRFVLVKQAKVTVSDVYSPVRLAYGLPADLLGRLGGAKGATPLTSAITSGLLNAGLGYAGAEIYNSALARPLRRQFPTYFSGQALDPAMTAVLAGGASALPHLYYGWAAGRAQQQHWDEAVAQSGAKTYDQIPDDLKAWEPGARNYLGMSSYGYGERAPLQGPGLATLTPKEGSVQHGATGGLYAPSIPVDAFNRVVWAPWQQNNPYGSKSPFGDNSQPLQADPQATAAYSGLVTGAAALKNKNTLSIADVAQAAGYGMGGWMAGRVAQALTGLTPEATDKLSRLGLIGGITYSVAKTTGLVE